MNNYHIIIHEESQLYNESILNLDCYDLIVEINNNSIAQITIHTNIIELRNRLILYEIDSVVKIYFTDKEDFTLRPLLESPSTLRQLLKEIQAYE